MKKLFILSVALMSITSLYHCQNADKSVIKDAEEIVNGEDSWKKHNLKGKVKHIIDYGVCSMNYASFVEDSLGSILKAKLRIEESHNNKMIWTFDNEGKVLEVCDFYPDLITKHHIQTYKYDDKGNQIEWNNHNDDGSVSDKWIAKYNGQAKQVQRLTYSADGSLIDKIICKYDEQGNKSEESRFNKDGFIYRLAYYKYDKRDSLIEENEYTNVKWIAKTTYTYNINGKNQNAILWDNRTSEMIYKYDAKGNLVELKHRPPGYDIGYYIKKYRYEYDSKGNWVNKIYIDENHKFVEFHLREYEYYE